MPADTNEPTNPIADFAAALNPEGGALADALPFTLTAEPAPARPEKQPDLFSEDGPCE